MPRKYDNHTGQPELEDEFRELWRIVDHLKTTTTVLTQTVTPPPGPVAPAAPGTLRHWAQKVEIHESAGAQTVTHPLVTINSPYTHLRVGMTVFSASPTVVNGIIRIRLMNTQPLHGWNIKMGTRRSVRGPVTLIEFNSGGLGRHFPEPVGPDDGNLYRPENGDLLYYPITPEVLPDALTLKVGTPGLVCFHAWIWGSYVEHAEALWGNYCPNA